jgi:hypothetical protein
MNESRAIGKRSGNFAALDGLQEFANTLVAPEMTWDRTDGPPIPSLGPATTCGFKRSLLVRRASKKGLWRELAGIGH